MNKTLHIILAAVLTAGLTIAFVASGDAGAAKKPGEKQNSGKVETNYLTLELKDGWYLDDRANDSIYLKRSGNDYWDLTVTITPIPYTPKKKVDDDVKAIPNSKLDGQMKIGKVEYWVRKGMAPGNVEASFGLYTASGNKTIQITSLYTIEQCKSILETITLK